MAKCEVCGNDYDKSFEVKAQGSTHMFDSLVRHHALAPSCAHCGCKVIGYGVEGDGEIYCCAHCAKQAGVVGVDDSRLTSRLR